MDGDASFGAWIRRRRRALDLTQAELARLASCAPVMVRMIEADARRPSRELADRLAEHLQVAPADRDLFVQSARAERRVDALGSPAAPTRASAPPPAPVPVPPAPLVGREREAAAVWQRLLQPAPRLLTLTGPGGVGKTRLALQVAADLRDAGVFADGVAFVALEAVRDPGLVAATIARALGLVEAARRPPADQLTAEVRGKHLLLVLDNFEQVGEAAPLLADLLVAAARLKVLVTSRAALHLSAEHEFPVPPLRLPDPSRLPPVDELARVEAVALFVQRAQAVVPDFALTPENAPAVAAICARLDGLPLAIELAAARVKLFAPEALLPRLTRRLPELAGGARDLPVRQRTLRDTLAWSHDLLDREEQALFRWLAVFVGGCTIEAAERVRGGPHILAGLAALVDQSMVQREAGPAGEPRFRLLETVREYGLERLEASGETVEARRRHAAYYLTLAEAAEPRLRRAGQRAWLERLEVEHDNLRVALGWYLAPWGGGVTSAATERADAGLRLAVALAWFWHARGHHGEGRRWLERALATGDGAATPARAKGIIGLGMLVLPHGDHERAAALLEEGLALCRAAGDRAGIGWALRELGVGARFRGEYGRAIGLLEEGLAFLREVGDTWGIARALHELGIAVRNRGDSERAAALLEEGLSLFREVGDQRGVAWALRELGITARKQGDERRAAALLEEALALLREIGDRWGIARALQELGVVARVQGDHGRATALLEEGLPLLREVGDKRGIAWALRELGIMARGRGEIDQAAVVLEEGLALFREAGDKRGVAECLEELAGVACARGQPERAARLLGTAAALREGIGAPVPLVERAARDQTLAAAKAALGDGAFAAAWALGRAAPLEPAAEMPADAVARAAANALAHVGPPPAPPGPVAPLTRREREVAALLARRWTNRQIAAELGLAPRTVDGHVRLVLAKLGLAGRAEIAGRAPVAPVTVAGRAASSLDPPGVRVQGDHA